MEQVSGETRCTIDCEYDDYGKCVHAECRVHGDPKDCPPAEPSPTPGPELEQGSNPDPNSGRLKFSRPSPTQREPKCDTGASHVIDGRGICVYCGFAPATQREEASRDTQAHTCLNCGSTIGHKLGCPLFPPGPSLPEEAAKPEGGQPETLEEIGKKCLWLHGDHEGLVAHYREQIIKERATNASLREELSRAVQQRDQFLEERQAATQDYMAEREARKRAEDALRSQ